MPSIAYTQDGFEVHNLELTGNTRLSDDQLQSRMTTRGTGLLRRRLLGKDAYTYSADILQSDLRRIERLYQREGFLDVRAKLDNLKINDKNRSVDIVIQITEGEPVLVCGVGFDVVGPVGAGTGSPVIDTLSFINRLKSQPEQRFRDSLILQDQAVIVRALEDLGHPYVRVEPNLTVDREAHRVEILWQITPGPVCVFGDITVTGLRHAEENLIRKPLTFRPGDTYNRTALEKSQRRIYGLAIFHSVTVRAKLSGEEDTTVPVQVRVNEAPRLSSRLGVGYGREEKFRVYSDSYLLGFLGGARRLNLYLKHSDLEPYHVDLKFRQPAFITSYTTLEISPFLLRQREPAFDQVRYGGQVSLLHQLKSYLHGSSTYLFERVDLDTSSLGDFVFDTTGQTGLYNKSSVVLGLTFDNSTPMFSPDRGVYAASAFTISGVGLGADYHYTRSLIDIRRYQTVFGMVLAGRIKAGGIRSGDSPEFIPVEDRFYAGGSASVRGWSRAELGPRADDDTPIGGNSLLESSVELRYPILGILSGVVFCDFGNVWAGSYSYKLDDLRYSAGAGLRVRTPIGPIRFDVARPVSDIETTTQFHISVGEAF